MKNLLACLALLAAFSAGAQSTMPYNPDADDDSYIGVADVLGLLPLYGQQFGIDSSLTCDYDGTPIEEFWGNVWNGDIILDSMLVQYHVLDSAQVFIAGCPDPVWDVASYERAWTTNGFSANPTFLRWLHFTGPGTKTFRLTFEAQYGYFRFSIQDDELYNLGLTDVLGSYQGSAQTPSQSSTWYLPFPAEAASFDSSGIHFENWDGFLSSATYINILPYWHYAE